MSHIYTISQHFAALFISLNLVHHDMIATCTDSASQSIVVVFLATDWLFYFIVTMVRDSVV